MTTHPSKDEYGFHEVSTEFDIVNGGERWLKNIDANCWISVLYRRTGFGNMEWETALVFIHEVTGRKRTWKDRDCLIISGDRRAELTNIPKEQLRQWYADNIDGNRNSMETLLEALKSNDNQS